MTSRPLLTVLRLTATEAPLGTAVLGVLVVLRAALTAGFAVAVSLLIGAVAGPPPVVVWPALVLLATVFLGQLVAQPAAATLATVLGRRVTARTAQLVVDGMLRPAGVGHLHDPAVADRVTRARAADNTGLPAGRAVSALAGIATARLGAVGSAALLASVLWWAPLPLVAAWLVAGRRRRRQITRVADATVEQSTDLRRASYLRRLALESPASREVRLFGMADWLATGFVGRWTAGMADLRGRRQGLADLGAVAGLAVAHAVVFAAVAHQAATGALDVAAVALAVSAALGTSSLGWLGDVEWQAAKAATAAPPAVELGRLPRLPAAQVRTPTRPAADLPRRAITFHDVHFGYSADGVRRPVLDGVDLVLPAGRSIALVGDNGVGKTTLMALLARLYEPDGGRITVDGHDLRDLDLTDWRRRLAVVFQRPDRLDLTARDNVGFGRPDAPRGDADLAAALSRAGADQVFAGLPLGWDTPLNRAYQGGHELSGGQWQRLALARAMFAVEHGASVLVLDEPTAHLDVRAERELYERFLDLTAGLTTVLISHRFATVRMADQICVLHHGRVAEAGTHEQLLATGGRYAAMFALQARRLVGEQPIPSGGGRG